MDRGEETGEGLTDQELRNEVTTFIGAGNETTAVTLAWAWYLLSKHPEAARKLHAELDTVLGGRAPSAQDLPQLPYTRMILEETMQLYPAVSPVRHIDNASAEAVVVERLWRIGSLLSRFPSLSILPPRGHIFFFILQVYFCLFYPLAGASKR